MTVGLWRFDDLIQELAYENSGDFDQGVFEDKAIDTSDLWRLAYLNVKVLCSLFIHIVVES